MLPRRNKPGAFTGTWVASGKRQHFDFVVGREVGTFDLAGNVSLKDEFKEKGIRPSRPLAIATVASQVAITASPISAAVVFFSSELEKAGVGYIQLLMIAIPSSFIACMLVALVTNFLGKDLKDDPVCQERLAKGLVKESGL